MAMTNQVKTHLDLLIAQKEKELEVLYAAKNKEQIDRRGIATAGNGKKKINECAGLRKLLRI